MTQMQEQYMFSKVVQLSLSELGCAGHAFQTVMFLLWFLVLLAPLDRYSQP